MIRPWIHFAAVTALYRLVGVDIIQLKDERARLRYQLDETLVENAKLAMENTRLTQENARLKEARGLFRGVVGSREGN